MINFFIKNLKLEKLSNSKDLYSGKFNEYFFIKDCTQPISFKLSGVLIDDFSFFLLKYLNIKFNFSQYIGLINVFYIDFFLKIILEYLVFEVNSVQ